MSEVKRNCKLCCLVEGHPIKIFSLSLYIYIYIYIYIYPVMLSKL